MTMSRASPLASRIERRMGVAENKALVLRFYEEVWAHGDVAFACLALRPRRRVGRPEVVPDILVSEDFGRHSGAWGDAAPTGRKVSFSGVNIFRFGDAGRVVEIWNHRDDLGLMEQLGAPVFAGAKPAGADVRA
jgi:hypothetical protein